ncbi:MAG: DUF1343 domain-containing protein [Desulfobacterales bacterium]|jgi:uncharacterized protein YbbC (DUF1343 family)|nr:DUF1343 domain-containing protein [Desulfobacterales bacterium]
MNPTIQTGLEHFLTAPPKTIHGQRLGLLCNPASVNSALQHARDLIHQRFPGQLTTLFSPQHGFFSEKQDNMIESANLRDEALGIPVYSLYGKTRKPTEEMFDSIDTLLIDLQDAGTRVYTFIYTMSYCLEAARKYGKTVIVLDRPNPVGGLAVEGNCLSKDCASFVGRFPIPMRHGMTIGELARLFNHAYGIGCDLSVIPIKGWRRAMYFEDTGLPWVAPSPNLPTPISALVYPGQVIWEGTNISEGRGTTQPFELFGAPFLNTGKILDHIQESSMPGVILRALGFEPTSNKWQGRLCRGFQLHVTDRATFRPYRTTLLLMQTIIGLHRKDFSWKAPPYEYEYSRLPIDLILGDCRIRKQIERLENIDKVEASWMGKTAEFHQLRETYLLY